MVELPLDKEISNYPIPAYRLNAAGGAVQEDMKTSVEPGSSEIKVTVSLSYEIR